MFPDHSGGEEEKPWSGGGGWKPPSGGNRPQGGYGKPIVGGGRPPSGQNWPQNGGYPQSGSIKPQSKGLKVLYSWKQMDYTFPNDSMRQEMLKNQLFIPKNTLILDVDVYGKSICKSFALIKLVQVFIIFWSNKVPKNA